MLRLLIRALAYLSLNCLNVSKNTMEHRVIQNNSTASIYRPYRPDREIILHPRSSILY